MVCVQCMCIEEMGRNNIIQKSAKRNSRKILIKELPPLSQSPPPHPFLLKGRARESRLLDVLITILYAHAPFPLVGRAPIGPAEQHLSRVIVRVAPFPPLVRQLTELHVPATAVDLVLD